MSKISERTISLLAVVLGISVAVSAAAIVVSNVLTTENDVIEQPIVLSHVAVDVTGLGGEVDHPAWGAGEILKGMTYDDGIRLQSSVALDSVLVHFKVSKVGINASDVVVKYYDPITVAWYSLTLTDNGDYLSGTYGPHEGFPVTDGYDVTTDILGTFAVTGHFTTEIWAEAI